MAHFVLAVLIPLPCDDPLDAVEQALQPYAGEGNKTDGWEILEWQWSHKVDATPYAYLAPDGSWHERQSEAYPEERARAAEQRALVQAHLAQSGWTELAQLRAKVMALPEPLTDWHREWQRVTHETRCLVAFVWCHV